MGIKNIIKSHKYTGIYWYTITGVYDITMPLWWVLLLFSTRAPSKLAASAYNFRPHQTQTHLLSPHMVKENNNNNKAGLIRFSY